MSASPVVNPGRDVAATGSGRTRRAQGAARSGVARRTGLRTAFFAALASSRRARRSFFGILFAALVAVVLVPPARAQAPAGSTLSPDGLGFLVSKDLAGERWAIVLSFVPRFDASGGIESYTLRSVSGNVFPTDGGPPAFVFCEPNARSTGDLGDPNSTFRFRCFGSGPCATTAIACAQNDFDPIADDVAVSASFFLPPGGLGVAPGAKIVQSAGSALSPAGSGPYRSTPGGASASSTTEATQTK